MKFTQNPCSIRLPNTKSANARSELYLLDPSPPCSITSPVTPSMVFEVFFAVDAAVKVVGGRSEVCMRREAVRTNWPTAAEKPERKALKGWGRCQCRFSATGEGLKYRIHADER